MTFWETLEHPWQVAFTQAWEAYCAGSLPIGAVITRNGKIIAKGRNRLGENHIIDRSISGTNIGHAEINALIQIPVALEGKVLSLYTTVEPCPMCAGAIRLTHIGNVFYAARDPWAGCANLLETHSYMARHWLKVHGLQDSKLEQVSLVLLLHHFLEQNDAHQGFLAAFAPIQQVVEWAQVFHVNGKIRTWRDAKVTAQFVLNELAVMLES
jgi:tRNA(adenine34) deaminase